MTELLVIKNQNSALSVFEQQVQTIEKEFLKQEQVDCPVVHRFGPNIYIREVTLPSGSFSIGHYQKTTHMNVMLTGRVTMVNEDGSKKELIAPQTFVSGPGRKVGYIHETVIWQNIYSTDETDIEKLEEMFLDKSITFKQHQEAQKLLLTLDNNEDVEDYRSILQEFNITEDLVRKQTENTEDQIEMPYGNYSFMITNSNIQGKGVFATKDFKEGEIVGPARIRGMRTPLGRFTNHAKNSNAKMVLNENGDIDLIVKSSIKGCKGGQLGEEITVNYRQVLMETQLCQE